MNLFLTSNTIKKYGGSDYIEIQYCRLSSSLKTIVSVDSIRFKKEDSLFVRGDDMDLFYEQYCGIFGNGFYNNEKCGTMDLCGINYYPPASVTVILKELMTQKPLDYETLADWLKQASETNGIYILGE